MACQLQGHGVKAVEDLIHFVLVFMPLRDWYRARGALFRIDTLPCIGLWADAAVTVPGNVIPLMPFHNRFFHHIAFNKARPMDFTLHIDLSHV